MTSLSVSRRGLFRGLLAAIAAPLLPRPAHRAVRDCDSRCVASYWYDSQGRLISEEYTYCDDKII